MRTWLFVPGHDPHKLRNALASLADVVIIDWEDAVPSDRKGEARANTAALLSERPAAPRCFVRINGVLSPYFRDDVAALAQCATEGVMLPKVASAAEVHELASKLDLPVIPLIETSIGIESALEIAGAHEHVERLGFGALDFMADLGVEWTPENSAYQYARTRVSIANRAAGLPGAIDGVYPLLQDYEGLRRDSEGARALGYVGKMVLHPAQIGVVREVFSPTEKEVKRAREVLDAFQEAQRRGESAVRLGEGFIDPPVVLWARRVVGMRDGEVADQKREGAP